MALPPENEFPPDLQRLLENLDERQQLDRSRLELIHDSEGIPDHVDPAVAARHNEKQWNDLLEKHATERDRYIKEFYAAKELAQELEKQAAQDVLRPDFEQSKGFSR